MKSVIRTITGTAVDPESPQPEQIHARDIATALGNLCAFGGHCRFYSLAQHSLLCSLIVAPNLALHALLLNAPSAYIGTPSPSVRLSMATHSLDAFAIYEAGVLEAIEKALPLPPTPPGGALDVLRANEAASDFALPIVLGEQPGRYPTIPSESNGLLRHEVDSILTASPMAPRAAASAYLSRLESLLMVQQ